MIKKFLNFISMIRNYNKGMTYVEIIVVLTIMGTMSAIAIFNYGSLQKRIEISNLSSEIALKIVEAQKSAMSGVFPPHQGQQNYLIDNNILNWRPSYGVYFNTASDNKSFTFFSDLNNWGYCDQSCEDQNYSSGYYDHISTFHITNKNFISKMEFYKISNPTPTSVTNISFDFTRPDSSAVIASSLSASDPISIIDDVDYVEITVSSEDLITVKSVIRFFPSGRIQIK